MKVWTYEDAELMAPLIAAAFRLLVDDQILVVREPWRWKRVTEPASSDIDDRQAKYPVIPNAYESQSIETVCESNGWKLVHDFHHFAIVEGPEI